jgi:hypothetical protein
MKKTRSKKSRDTVPLKEQCQEFDFWFFSWISFPQAPEYTIRAVSNFWHRWQICRRHRWHRWQLINNTSEAGGKFATRVVDTGGAPWLGNISANFRKNSKRSKWVTLGLGGTDLWKKPEAKNLATLSLKPYPPPNLGFFPILLIIQYNTKHYSNMILHFCLPQS